MDPIYPVKPQLDKKEYDSVMEVLLSGFLAEGNKTKQLEKEFAEYTGAKHAVFAANGTLALYLALESLDLPVGKEIITTGFTFIASSNSCAYVGTIPKFVDINPKTFNIDPEAIEAAITKDTVAIMPVHIFGNPANMKVIMEIAEKHDLKVIEDCAQAHGAKIDSKHVGNFGDVGCFSFYASKNMIAGEGGMVITNDDELAKKMRSIKNHGRAADSFGGYAHFRIGYNFRAPDINAAIALEQLRKLPGMLIDRKRNAEFYHKEMADLPLQFQETIPEGEHCNYICAPALTTDKITVSEVVEKTKEAKIFCRALYDTPTYKQPAYLNINENWKWAKAGIKYPDYSKLSLPVTEKISKTHFEIPVHPGVSQEAAEYITSVLKNILE